MGLKVALPIGVFTGLAVFVPYLGFGLGLIMGLLAAKKLVDAVGGIVLFPTTTGGCGSSLPVTFRDFAGFDGVGGHVDFELSNVYVAGGTNWRTDKYGEPTPGTVGYKGLNEAGCGLVAASLGPDSKPQFASGLGMMRTLFPARNSMNTPSVVQHVTGCQAWNWDWTPPNDR